MNGRRETNLGFADRQVKRRGRGEHSIFLRADGRWCAIVSMGYGPDGKRRRKSYYAATKTELIDRLHSVGPSSAMTMAHDARNISVRSHIQRWLEDDARPKIASGTYRLYRDLMRNHVEPLIGSIPIVKLSPMHLTAMMSTLEGTGVSPRVRQQIHAVLHRALGQAVKWRLIPTTPIASVSRPKVPKRSMRVWTQDEAKRFLEAARGNRYYALFVLALTTGMRQGELLGLTRPDFDQRAGTLSIRHTLLDNLGKPELSEPKTPRSRRLIQLSDVAIDALRTHLRRLMADKSWQNDWLFPNAAGGPTYKRNLMRDHYEPLVVAAKVPRIRFHDLRHTAATLMLAEGIHPKIVQEMLGHASIQQTLDTYSHVTPTMQQAAADRMDAIFRVTPAMGDR